MRFLIDADLPRSTKALLEQHGHEAMDARDVGLRKAKDPVIAVFELPGDASAAFILRLVEGFVQQTELLKQLPGRLATISAGRIRLRPA